LSRIRAGRARGIWFAGGLQCLRMRWRTEYRDETFMQIYTGRGRRAASVRDKTFAATVVLRRT